MIRSLKRCGVRNIVMLTGDTEPVAWAITEAAGISHVLADVFPEDKMRFVEELPERKRQTVALVGDGINDSRAMAQADVGIAVDGGAEVAKITSHVTLLDANLWKFPQAIHIARQAAVLINQDWRIPGGVHVAQVGRSARSH